jgi:hypothetical protein
MRRIAQSNLSLATQPDKRTSAGPRLAGILPSNMVRTNFTFFFDQDLMIEYRQYQRAYFDSSIMLAGFFVGMIFLFARANFVSAFYDGFHFSCAFILICTALVIYLILLSSHLIKDYADTEQGYFHQFSTFVISNPSMRFLSHDFLAVCGTLGFCFGLYSRVLSGQCPADVTIWGAQRCNHLSSAKSVPMDHVMFVSLCPIFCQLLISGMSFGASLTCCIVSTASVALSIIHVDGKLDIWVLLSSFIIMLITYNHEKLARLTFTHTQRVSAIELDKRKHIMLHQQAEHDLFSEKNKHQIEMQTMIAEEERRLMESEKKQMIALLGNVAHDLKTPLQAFLMDLESLKTALELSRGIAMT